MATSMSVYQDITRHDLWRLRKLEAAQAASLARSTATERVRPNQIAQAAAAVTQQAEMMAHERELAATRIAKLRRSNPE